MQFFRRGLRHVKGKLAGEPFELESWQEDIVRDVFGTLDADEKRVIRTVYCEIPRKNGKALGVNTPIPVPTRKGWVRHGDLKPGDLVFAPDGRQVSVTAVTVPYVGPCYRLEFADGTFVEAHENHEWVTNRTWFTGRRRGPNNGDLPAVTSRQISETLVTTGNRPDRVHSVDVPQAIRCPERSDFELIIDPYLLGAWLGDGTSAAAQITTVDDEILKQIESGGCDVRNRPSTPITYGLGTGWLHTRLRLLGLLKNKHIPREYLRAGIEQRWQLLRGLMDTDGYVSKVGQCEFTTVKPQLRDDTVELIRSLGLKCKVSTKRAILNGKDCGEKHRIQFYGYSDRPPVLLKRKRRRLKDRPKRRTRTGTKFIVSCEPCGDRIVNCIQVDGGMYLCGDGWTPTHNSTLAAGVLLYMLLCDGEEGAEVYSAASTRDQAGIIFDIAAGMVRKNPELSKLCKIRPSGKRIFHKDRKYEACSSDVGAPHGTSPHCVIFDEVHLQKNRDLWDAFQTGLGARQQPLVFAITTAGHDRSTLCWELHQYAKSIIDGRIEDPTFYPVIFGSDPADDWTDERVWEKANPCLDVSLSREFLRTQCRQAKENPAFENTFRRLHLNQWTQQEARVIPMRKWDACETSWRIEDFRSRVCYAGLDLASTRDVTALSLVFPEDDGGASVLPWMWIPEDNVDERSRQDQRMLRNFAERGHLEFTSGNHVDVAELTDRIYDICEPYDLQYIGYDPWNADGVVQALQMRGIPERCLIKMPQGYRTYNEAFKTLLTWIGSGQLRHDGHEVLRWMAGNTAAREDARGNLMPDKGKSGDKIDGISAMLMGIALLLHYGSDAGAYATSGSGIQVY